LAVGQWERPLLGQLVDPFARVTSYGWPGWSGFAAGLSYPDRVLAVDGQPLLPPYGRSLDALAEQAARAHLPAVQLSVDTADGAQRHVLVHCQQLGLVPWMFLCGGYLMLAWLWLLPAGLSYTVRPRGGAVTVFVRLVMLSAGLIITVFDYHTT